MKNIWKWILGILLIVVIVAGLVGAAFAIHNSMTARFAYRLNGPGGAPNIQPNPGPQSKPGFPEPGMWGRFPGEHRSMFGHGFGFGPAFFLLGGLMRLIPLVLVILLIVGAYLLGRRSQAPVMATAGAAVASHACPKCGNPVQDDAKYCPSCGKKQ